MENTHRPGSMTVQAEDTKHRTLLTRGDTSPLNERSTVNVEGTIACTRVRTTEERSEITLKWRIKGLAERQHTNGASSRLRIDASILMAAAADPPEQKVSNNKEMMWSSAVSLLAS
jgi:hypothetical protein